MIMKEYLAMGAMACITFLESALIFTGQDGATFGACIAVIAALGGYIASEYRSDVRADERAKRAVEECDERVRVACGKK